MLITGGRSGLPDGEGARGPGRRRDHRQSQLDGCEAVADEVRALGRRALAVSVHAAKWDSIDQLIETAYGEFGRVDICINSVGRSPGMASDEVPEALFDSVIGSTSKARSAWPRRWPSAWPPPMEEASSTCRRLGR